MSEHIRLSIVIPVDGGFPSILIFTPAIRHPLHLPGVHDQHRTLVGWLLLAGIDPSHATLDTDHGR